MAIHTSPALILRRWNFRETSLIISVLTESYGKFHGLIKGFYGRPPRYGPVIPGSLNTIVFYESLRQQLLLVSQCDLQDALASQRHGPRQLQAQARILELTEKGTVERDPQPALFQLTAQALRQLAQTRQPEALVRVYEVKCLKLLGLSPSIEECVRCQGEAEARAVLSLRQGGLLCRACAASDQRAESLSPGTLAALHQVLTAPWETALRVQWLSPIREELDRLLTRFIAYHVEARFTTRERTAYA